MVARSANHAEGVYIINGSPLYIINSAGIVYHQHEVLYIIIVKAIYTFGDDIRLRR